jgi:hypothetical protein
VGGGSFGNGGFGGGGGWYGGGGGAIQYSTTCYPSTPKVYGELRSSGGGSGYVLTATSARPSGYNPDPKYYLSVEKTLAGDESMPRPNDTYGTGTGINAGHARISYTKETQDNVLLGTDESGYSKCEVETWSDTEIVCTTSAHADGAVNLSIGNNEFGVTKTNAYTYEPTITTIDTSECAAEQTSAVANGDTAAYRCVLSVHTNDTNGYGMYLSTIENNNNMLPADTDANDNFIAPVAGSLLNPAALGANNWGFAIPKTTNSENHPKHDITGLVPTGFDDVYNLAKLDSEAKFAAVPTNNSLILIKKTNTSTLSQAGQADYTTTFFGAKVGMELKVDTYKVIVLYTVIPGI